MNREQRRMYAKQVQKKERISRADALKFVNDNYKIEPLEEGQTVLINSAWIKAQPDYKFQPQEFKDWVEKYKEGLYHVEYNDSVEEKDRKIFVSLKEDEEPVKRILRADALSAVNVSITMLDDDGKPLEDQSGAFPMSFGRSNSNAEIEQNVEVTEDNVNNNVEEN